MSEIPISPQIWKLAAAILTQKQMTALELREKHGFSWNQLAVTMNTVRSTVKEHHRAAVGKLLNAIETAGGDIDLALANAQPRPASEETAEEKRELDRLWAETRPTSEETHDHREPEPDRGDDQQARPETERRDRDQGHRPELPAHRIAGG